MTQISVIFMALLLLGGNVQAQQGADTVKKSPVILTVSGSISAKPVAQFTLDQLQRLPSATYTVKHEWSDTKHSYRGPLLSAVLKEVNAQGKHLKLIALNEYQVELTTAFVDRWQPILAWEEDGRQMRIRNKGPLWLMTPLADAAELNQPEHITKLIWQLSRIEVQ